MVMARANAYTCQRLPRSLQVPLRRVERMAERAVRDESPVNRARLFAPPVPCLRPLGYLHALPPCVVPISLVRIQYSSSKLPQHAWCPQTHPVSNQTAPCRNEIEWNSETVSADLLVVFALIPPVYSGVLLAARRVF